MAHKTLPVPDRWVEAPICITLAGVGGTGSEMLDGLVRLHMALSRLGHPGLHVSVWDPDEVSSSNIGRQRFYPGDEGQSKAILSVHRINMFNGLAWEAHHGAFDIEQDHRQIKDLLITCLDRASERVRIGQLVRNNKRYAQSFWLDTGNGANTGQMILGQLTGHKTWLPNVFDLYPELVDHDDAAEPSCSFEQALSSQDLLINRLVADSAIDLLWQWIRQGSISHHGAFIESSPMRVTPLAIDPAIWASFGWQCAQEDAN